MSFLIFGSNAAISQKRNATIKFNDGTKLKGYAKLTSKDRIKFRKNLDEQAVKYDFDKCEYVEIAFSDEKIKYVQLPIKGKGYKIIVKERVIGPLSLYVTTNSGYAPTAGNFGTAAGMAPGSGVSYSIDDYYLKESGNDSLIHMGSNHLFSGKFNRKGSDFFYDCAELASKIRNKEKGFRKKNMEEIVNFYNKKCQK